MGKHSYQFVLGFKSPDYGPWDGNVSIHMYVRKRLQFGGLHFFSQEKYSVH